MRRGRQTMKDDPEDAWTLFKTASELDPADGRPRDALREVEDLLKQTLASDGVEPNRVPVLKVPLDRLTSFNFTPNEGFVLSRINGSWDVKSIVKISPIREMEVLLAFKKLVRDGVIEWKVLDPVPVRPQDSR
jgi:hypothetical protein